jgi:hypothetical protein
VGLTFRVLAGNALTVWRLLRLTSAAVGWVLYGLVWIHAQGFAGRRLYMILIMARPTMAAVVEA